MSVYFSTGGGFLEDVVDVVVVELVAALKVVVASSTACRAGTVPQWLLNAFKTRGKSNVSNDLRRKSNVVVVRSLSISSTSIVVVVAVERSSLSSTLSGPGVSKKEEDVDDEDDQNPRSIFW